MAAYRANGTVLRLAPLAVAVFAAVGCSSGGEAPPSGPGQPISVSTSGAGIVTSSPAGLACGHGGPCTWSFVQGTTVTLTATPDPGWAFSGWSGPCVGIATCSVPVTEAATVGAAFVPLRLLTTTASGGGTITTTLALPLCSSSTCSVPLAEGTVLTLVASPASGWTFAGWSGPCATAGGFECSLTLSADTEVVATFTPAVAGAVTFQGRVTYDFVPATYDPVTRKGTLDFDAAVPKPVRGAVVQVLDGTKVLMTATTDPDGNYAITFFPGAATTVRLWAVARTTTPIIQVEDNTAGDAVWSLQSLALEPTSGTHHLHATHGWGDTSYSGVRAAAPFAILDSMYTAARAFLDIPRSVPFPPLKVNWSPQNAPTGDANGWPSYPTGAIVTSHYNPSDGEIYILGQAGVDTDEFDAHVIVHEWGHYFESKLSRSDSPGGPHGSGDVLDPRLSFGEGYGSALASMVLPAPVYVDTLWNAGAIVAFGMSAETPPTPTDDGAPGPFSELSMLRLLYDLFDGGAAEPWDGVALGLGPIYDVLVGPQRTTPALTTAASFLAALKARPGVDVAGVDALAAHYGIGPVADAWGTGDAGLRAAYRDVPSLPFTDAVTFTGGALAWNKRAANQYWVVPGTGRNVTVSSFSAGDVGLTAYRAGQVVSRADRFYGGETEVMTFPTAAGATYVVVLTGWEGGSGSYPASFRVESP